MAVSCHTATDMATCFRFSATVFACLCRWTRTAELLDALVACLNIPTTTVTPPDTSPNHPPTPRQPPPYTAQHPSAAPLSLSHTKATTVHRANSVRWGLHKTQRLALLVIATLMQQHQSRLMAHLVQGGETIREGGLSQCLLTMVESVSRDDSGGKSCLVSLNPFSSSRHCQQ